MSVGMNVSKTPNRFACQKIVGLVAVLLLVMATPSPAATSVSTVTTGSESPNLRIRDDQLVLTLEEAHAIALEKNLSLVVDRLRHSESELSLWQSEGIYDPNLTLDLTAFEENQPSASNLDGADVQIQENLRWSFGLSRLFSAGGTGSILWNNSRFKTNSQFATLNPSYRADFDLNFRQPLLRNFGRLATNRLIRIARTNIDISRETFEQQVVATLQSVEDAYWNLVEAQEQLGVTEESRALAKQLHEQNRIRVDVGTLAPLELVQSEAGIATREEEVIRASALVGDSEDALRQLMNLEDQNLWTLPIILETDPERDAIEIDVDTAIGVALAERNELRSKRLSQQNLDRDTLYFKNQIRPNMNLDVTYGFNGLGGDIFERDFITGQLIREVPGNYQDSLDQIATGDFDGWSVALNIAYPLGNRNLKAQRALADVTFERGEAELRDLELQVSTEVRRIARFVRTAEQALASARVSRHLEEQNLEAEQKRYENGMSTSFRVLDIQEDLTSARSREVAAVTGYRKALVQYYRAIGRLTEESGVEIVEPEL